MGNCAALVNLYSIRGWELASWGFWGEYKSGGEKGGNGLRGQKGGKIGGGRERGYLADLGKT